MTGHWEKLAYFLARGAQLCDNAILFFSGGPVEPAMHEMAVTQSILDIAIKHAVQAGASRITRINLVIGELSGVVDDSVQFYFDFLSKATMADGAQLVFDRRPAVYRCRECGSTYHPDGFDWVCPACEALAFEVISGREFQIESLEVDGGLTDAENQIE